jgi:phage gp36-like protein
MYCTKQNIIDDMTLQTLLECTDDLNENTVNDTIVDGIISMNTDVINGYIQANYTLPIEDNPILKMICISLCVCDLYQRRLGLDYSDSLTNRRNLALKMLDKIQSGVMTLTVAIDETPKQSSHLVSSRTQRFSSDVLDCY